MIQRNTDNFTGFIIQDTEKVYFHAQDKIFYFISKGAGIFAGLMKQDLKSPDHFLYGYTADGYQLALYTGYEERKVLFDYLGDCISNLHTVISSDAEGKATYLMDFYADSDSDYVVLTDDKVKNICSSIECELDFVKDLKDDENENLKELIKEIKKVIRDHRKSEKKLEDKTYDMIGSSMSHWGMANSRKIYLLYEKNKIFMDILKTRTSISCTEEDVIAFVKYRNDITHGRYRTVDSVIATASYTLMALAYSCFLTRMGMQENELKKLFEEDKIAS